MEPLTPSPRASLNGEAPKQIPLTYRCAVMPLANPEQLQRILSSFDDEGWEYVQGFQVVMHAGLVAGQPPQPALYAIFRRKAK